MPQAVTGIAARPPIGGALAGHIERLTHALASAFEMTRPEQREQAIHWLLLSVALIGATVVRFWGLGTVGLHGDEETMAMAVRGILEQGAPILPSGMFYPRGLTQLALMSLSVSAFGESEWALRLPSAICGIVLVAVGYFASRRFLRPSWALALAFTLAFLPQLVIYSQTARMYIFLVTFIAAAMLCLFAWERTNRLSWLIGAIVALIFGLEMHSLAVACILMLLVPGAIRGDVRRIAIGLVAMLAVGIGFVTIEAFVNAQYPEPPSDLFGGAGLAAVGPSVSPVMPLGSMIAFGVAGVALVYIAIRLSKALTSTPSAVFTAAVLLVGVALQLVLFYHLAALFYAVGIASAARSGTSSSKGTLGMFIFGAAAIAICHVVLLAPEAGTLLRLVGALNGQPSTWPYARLTEFSVVGALLCGALLAWGLYRFARKQPLPDFWLLALLGVWAPAFALGLFAWDVPSRYMAMSLLPLLICALAFGQWMADRVRERALQWAALRHRGVWAAMAGLLVIDPFAVASTIDAGYSIHPDHKGAAEFIRAQGITENDVVLAEDVLQQTFYLGRVDYWLIGPSVARRFVMKTDKGIVDFYTGTPVVVTAEMLEDVLKANRGKRVFVIGSGEDWDRGRRATRGDYDATLHSERFETVYLGRDGLTRVFRAVTAPAPAHVAAPSPEKTQQKLEQRAEAALENAALESAAPSTTATP